MRWNIEPKQTTGFAGWHAYVRLIFDDKDEHAAIHRNKCGERHIIFPQPPFPGVKFKDVYGAVNHAAMLPVDSSTQTDIYIGLLDKGLREIDALIQRARRTVPAPAPRQPTAWNFFDKGDERFSHTWVLATTGSGKTTLLSALINEDLEKVKRREASVLIIDSENEHLSHHLPRLKRFGPGGDLYGKLIYLAPDLLHPLALNIFDFTDYQRLDANERLQMLNTVRDMLMFFIGALIGELSGHMRTIINYALRAIVLIPNPTVFTFSELLAKGGLAKLTQEYPVLQTLDARTTQFLTSDMFTDYGQSIGGVRSRLNTITQNEFTEATFAQPKNRLNLFELLKEPYVIVVNTNHTLLGDETCALFGRFFLASLLRVVNRRIGGGLPVYVYADEAQQYIAQEEAVIDLIRKARRQKVSLTLAHHQHSDIASAAVLQALKGAAIHFRPSPPSPPYKWLVTVRQGLPIEVTPPNVDFKAMPKMTAAQWQDIMDGMHACFSPPRPTTKNNFDDPLPDADAR
jgi:hypothetical protein